MDRVEKPFSPRRKRGFERTSGLLQSRIREAGEGRGFSHFKLLTHWEETVGSAIANISEPVKMTYAKGGFGATLVILTAGAHAPLVQQMTPEIIEKVNALYGYRAISRVHVTQTASHAVGRKTTSSEPPVKKEVTPDMVTKAETLASGAEDENLRDALEAFAKNFMKHNS